MRSILMVSFLLASLPFSALQGSACTRAEIEKMRADGLSDAQIRQICGKPPAAARNKPPQPRADAGREESNVCETPSITCRLNRKGTVGKTCWCNTPNGPIRGLLVAPR